MSRLGWCDYCGDDLGGVSYERNGRQMCPSCHGDDPDEQDHGPRGGAFDLAMQREIAEREKRNQVAEQKGCGQ